MENFKLMFFKKSLIVVFAVYLFSIHLSAQRSYPPDIVSDTVVVYKSTPGVELKLWIFMPENHSKVDQTPAIVFYFGGGWNAGSPEQFVEHCKYLAARGMVAMVADYRVASRNDVKVDVCVADAKSAIRWVRENSETLGVHPDRIGAGGGSAGGHLAAATAMLSKFDEAGENMQISAKPNAMVLFNPALVLAPIGGESLFQKERLENLAKRLGAKPEDISPFHNIAKSIAPCIIFHGTSDKTVPIESVKTFSDQMKKLGNDCTLVAYEDEGHGFFNYGRRKNEAYFSTLSYMDDFFVDLGWLTALPEPNIQ